MRTRASNVVFPTSSLCPKQDGEMTNRAITLPPLPERSTRHTFWSIFDPIVSFQLHFPILYSRRVSSRGFASTATDAAATAAAAVVVADSAPPPSSPAVALRETRDLLLSWMLLLFLPLLVPLLVPMVSLMHRLPSRMLLLLPMSGVSRRRRRRQNCLQEWRPTGKWRPRSIVGCRCCSC